MSASSAIAETATCRPAFFQPDGILAETQGAQGKTDTSLLRARYARLILNTVYRTFDTYKTQTQRALRFCESKKVGMQINDYQGGIPLT